MSSLLALTVVAVTVVAPGNARDWVGLFDASAANTAYIDWVYVACDGKTCPAAKAVAGSAHVIHLTLPATMIDADIRLMTFVGNPPVYTMLDGIRLIKPIHCSNPACSPPPTPIVTFSPISPSLPDNSAIGTQIATVNVTMSDGSSFTGTLDFALPYLDGGGICTIQNGNVILGTKLPAGASTKNCTIRATQ